MFNLFKGPNEDDRNRTTKKIALVLLYSFIFSVFLLFIINLFIHVLLKNETTDGIDIDLRKGWFDLLKNALVLLSTALTTVIGYYFGQREGEKKAEAAEKQLKEADEIAKKEVEKAYTERNEAISGTLPKESDADDTDEPPTSERDSGIRPIS